MGFMYFIFVNTASSDETALDGRWIRWEWGYKAMQKSKEKKEMKAEKKSCQM